MMEKTKLAMVCFIFSEANFFLALILAYIYYHVQQMTGPTAASSLAVGRTALFSVALFSSSFTVHRAGRSLHRGRGRSLRLWLLATILLGAIFLVGQGTEYWDLLRRGVTVSRNLFGTTFFTLTGFHGLHVLVGLIALSVLLGLTRAGDLSRRASPAVEAIALYWHFVDAVWVVIFGVVYLWILA
jgi:heme/copper-type cytochrome/quinol oxidase subunit 3